MLDLAARAEAKFIWPGISAGPRGNNIPPIGTGDRPRLTHAQCAGVARNLDPAESRCEAHDLAATSKSEAGPRCPTPKLRS